MAPGYLRSNHRLLGFIQILMDAAIICITFLAAFAIYQDSIGQLPRTYVLVMIAGIVIFYITAINMHLYDSWRSDQLNRHLSRLLKVWFLTIVVLVISGWALKVSDYFSRLVIGVWFISTPVVLGLSRGFLRSVLGYFRAQGRNTRFIAVIGNSKAGQSFIDEIHANEWMGYVIKAQYWIENPVDCSNNDLVHIIDAIKQQRHDEIFIALPMSAEDIITRLVDALSDSSIPVHIIPDLFTFNLMNARMTRIGSIPAISVFDSPHDDLSEALKRAEDLVLASIILAFITPLMCLIALAIKMTSPGPVLFMQRRYGVGGEEISVWKFRSMRVCEDGDHVPQARQNDSRITPLGAFLRKTSLDELPQFINVLQGQMSIVGPRPHAVAHNELYRKNIHGYMLRHLVKPGITGWAQVNGWRGETDTLEKMEKRVQYDLEYIQNWSIFFDLKIIALTVVKGFINKNAY